MGCGISVISPTGKHLISRVGKQKSCAPSNDARKGVYLQKRTTEGPKFTTFLKMQSFEVC